MAGVNVKMGVSGVSQFKTAMREAQGCVKTLDQALKLNEQQFKATGDAESYMQQKAELLKSQIENQKNVVLQAENALRAMSQQGINPASTAFQKMQQEVLKAQGELLGMQTDLENIGVAGETAQNGVSGMNSQLQQIGKGVSYENVTNSISKITGALEAAGKKAFEVGQKILSSTLGAGSWADDLLTDASVFGLEPEDLQRMQKTSRLIDTSVEAIVAAQKKMNRGLGNNNADVMGAFAAFGIDPTRLATTEDKFWAIGDAIYHMSDAEEQEAYAQKVFGRGWSELNPLFEAGREEYDKMNASWNVVSNENLQKLGEMDDAYQKLSSEWESFQMTVLSALAEGLTPLMDTLTGLMQELNTYLETEEGQQMLENLAQAVQGLFQDLTQIDPQQVISGFTEVFDKITEGLQWIFDNRQGIIDAMKGIVTGWGLLKIGGGMLKVMELVNGIKGLTGSAASAAGAAAGSGWASAFGAAALKAVPWLAGLVALLTPAETQDNSIFNEKTGMLTEEGWWTYHDNPEQLWGEDLQKLGDLFGGTSEMINDVNVMNALARYKMGWNGYTWDDLLREMETLGYARPEDVIEPGPLLTGGNGPGLGDEVIHKDRRTINQAYEENMDRLTRVAEQNAQTTQQFAQNSVTSADLQNLTGLPAAVAAAVSSAMANVQIVIGGGAVQSISEQTGSSFFKNLVNSINTVASP